MVSGGDIRWHFAAGEPGERARFAGGRDPETLPGLTLVKESSVRRAWRLVDGQGPALLIKSYRPATHWDRLRSLWVRTKALAEFTVMQQARHLGLPVPAPLAWGTTRGLVPARGILVARWIDGSRTLAEVLRGERADEPLFTALGRLLRQACDAGLHLRDLHAGNVLVAPDGRLWLIDLHSARLARPLAAAARLRALASAALFLDFDAGPKGERFAALTAGFGPLPEGDLAGAFLRRRRRLLSSRLARCERTCSEFVAVRSVVVRRPATVDAAAGLAAQLAATAPLKSGRRGAVARVEAIAGTVFGKRRSHAHARALWRAHYALHLRGVPAAPALARAPDPGGRQAWVLTGGVGAGTDLGAVLAARPEAASTHELLRALGRAVARAHALRARLRDLKVDHVVVDESAGQCFLVDLDGVRIGRVTRLRAGKDLGRLLASAWRMPWAEKAHGVRAFLRAYLRERARLLAPVRDARALVRAALAAAAAWHRRHRVTLADAT